MTPPEANDSSKKRDDESPTPRTTPRTTPCATRDFPIEAHQWHEMASAQAAEDVRQRTDDEQTAEEGEETKPPTHHDGGAQRSLSETVPRIKPRRRRNLRTARGVPEKVSPPDSPLPASKDGPDRVQRKRNVGQKNCEERPQRRRAASSAKREPTAEEASDKLPACDGRAKYSLAEKAPTTDPGPRHSERIAIGRRRAGKSGGAPEKVAPSDPPPHSAAEDAPELVAKKESCSRRLKGQRPADGAAKSVSGKKSGPETVAPTEPSEKPGSQRFHGRGATLRGSRMMGASSRPETVPPTPPPEVPDSSHFGAGRTSWDLPAAADATDSSISGVAVSALPGSVAVTGSGTDADIGAMASSGALHEDDTVDSHQDALSAFVVPQNSINRIDSAAAVATPRTPPETETEAVYDGVAIPDRSSDAAEEKDRKRRRKQRLGAMLLLAAIGGGCYAAVVRARPLEVLSKTDISAGEVSHDSSLFPSSSRVPSVFLSSQIPSVSPSSSPTFDRLGHVRAVLFSHMDSLSPSSKMDDAESPQGRALHWIVEKDERRVDPIENEKSIVQRYALAVIYFSTGGPESWKDDFNFLSSQHECEWHIPGTEEHKICAEDYRGVDDCHEFAYVGAGCRYDKETVDVIAIANNNASGTLPPELGMLSDLNQIFFPGTMHSHDDMLVLPLGSSGRRGLSGRIPPTLFNMPSLELMFLSGNKFFGTLPEIVLGKNGTGGSRGSGLRKVYLAWNRINGTVPSTWGQLSRLSHLSLSNNRLTGSISSSLGKLHELESLYLVYNYLTGFIPSELGKLKKLEELHLDGNELSGSLPVEVCGLHSLKGGNLSRISLEDVDVVGCTPSCDVCGGRGGRERVLEQDLSLSFLPHIARYGHLYLSGATTCGSFFFPSSYPNKGVDKFISRLADKRYASRLFGLPEPVDPEVSCGLLQNLGVYCGCAGRSEPACSVCGAEGGTLANPQTKINDTLLENVTGGRKRGKALLGGFKPNCDFYENSFLPNMVEGSEECEAYRADTVGVCRCGGGGGDRAWGRPFIKDGGCKKFFFLHELVFVDEKNDGMAVPGSNFGADLPSPSGLAVIVKQSERELLRIPFDEKKLNPLKSNERVDDMQQYVCLSRRKCYSVEIVAETEGASVPVVAKTSHLAHAARWEVREVLTGSTTERAGKYGRTIARGSMFHTPEEEGTGGGGASEGCGFGLRPRWARKRKTAKPRCGKRTCEVPALDNIFDSSVANRDSMLKQWYDC